MLISTLASGTPSHGDMPAKRVAGSLSPFSDWVRPTQIPWKRWIWMDGRRVTPTRIWVICGVICTTQQGLMGNGHARVVPFYLYMKRLKKDQLQHSS